MKIAVFTTNYLVGKTAWNKAERFFNYLPFSFKFSPAIFRRRDSGAAFEKRDKRAKAVKADRKTRFGNARSGFQKFFCFFDSDSREILMRRFSVDSFKRADKMKFGIAGLVGNLAGINAFLIVAVNEKFCLNDAAIKVNFGQVSIDIGLLIITFSALLIHIEFLRFQSLLIYVLLCFESLQQLIQIAFLISRS